MTSVKMESGSTPIIKPDPDNKDSSPGAMSEDDIYEETGDLDFSTADRDVWLTKIPRFLYDNWSKLDDDEEIQIGTVRVENGPTDIQRVRFHGFIFHYSWRCRSNFLYLRSV